MHDHVIFERDVLPLLNSEQRKFVELYQRKNSGFVPNRTKGYKSYRDFFEQRNGKQPPLPGTNLSWLALTPIFAGAF